MKKKYIGVFDSGLGGLTTIRAIIEKMPKENIVFFADTKNVPYGSKSPQEIISLASHNLAFLQQYDLKAAVIACNTADSVAREKLDEAASVRLFGVIDPTARKAAEITENGRIGILATETTIKSQSYVKRIQKYNDKAEVFGVGCPLLVPMVESGAYINDKDEMRKVLLDYLKPLIDQDIDTLVLGCTHYDVLMDMCKEEYPELKIVSSSRPIADELFQYLKDDLNEDDEISRQYYVSSEPEKFIAQARMIIPEIAEIKNGGSD